MRKQLDHNPKWLSWLGQAALIVLGVTAALGASELLLRAFPNWVPRPVRVSPPARRVNAFSDETYDVKLSNGDLFYYMRDRIAPLSSDRDRVLSQVHFVTDGNGFRNATPRQATYDIVALGDSFTVGANVAAPWPQELAETTELEVLNLGEPGAGPQQELAILRQYGLDARPQWVVLAYFEGNDLYDAGGFEQANPFLVARAARYFWLQVVDFGAAGGSDAMEVALAAREQYPVIITINGRELETAFFTAYISWLSVSRAVIESSRNYQLTTDAILEMRALSEAAEARFLLVYVPVKAHVYLPHIGDPAILEQIFADVPKLAVAQDGYLQFTDTFVTADQTLQHLDDQANLMAEFAVSHDISYLNLTLAFQQAAAEGEELYYPYDTHWNQQGHELAAQTIAGVLRDEP